MRIRPFVLLGSAALAGVQRMLDAVLGEWCADWGVARDEFSLECCRAWEAGPVLPGWRAHSIGNGGAQWLAWTDEFQEQLQRLLFAPDRHYGPASNPGEIASAGGAAAWTALRRHLMQLTVPGADEAATHDVAAPPAEHWLRASGAVLLVLRIGKQVCHGLLDVHATDTVLQQARLRGLVQRDAPQVPLAAVDYRQALDAVPVTLPVVLGQARVGLGSLMALAVGDVIRLDSEAERPIAVYNPAGERLFDGYPGLAQVALALEVGPPAA